MARGQESKITKPLINGQQLRVFPNWVSNGHWAIARHRVITPGLRLSDGKPDPTIIDAALKLKPTYLGGATNTVVADVDPPASIVGTYGQPGHSTANSQRACTMYNKGNIIITHGDINLRIFTNAHDEGATPHAVLINEVYVDMLNLIHIYPLNQDDQKPQIFRDNDGRVIIMAWRTAVLLDKITAELELLKKCA